jgi:hypothetical protein
LSASARSKIVQKKFVIEIAALDMTIDERSLETVIMDRSLQFTGSGIRVCGRYCGESAETVRMAPHGIREVIVGFAGERRRLSSFELLCARGSKRQYLHIDVRCVHFRDPLVAKVAELFQKFPSGTAEFQSSFFECSPRTIEESRTREMFFKRYGVHDRSVEFWDAATTILAPSPRASDKHIEHCVMERRHTT